MYFTYGSYSTPTNSSWATMTMRAVLAQTGRKISEIQQWTIHTVLQSTTQAGLTSLIQAHEAGMRQNNVDLVFYQDDGTETAHKILTNNTRNGVEFRGLSYPGYFPPGWGQKTEYVNLRYVVTQLQAEVFDVENGLIFIQQSMRFSVGGIGYSVLGALTGQPQLQFTMQMSPFWGMQRGMAIGMFSNPEPVGPIVNMIPNPMQSWVQYDSPQQYGRNRHWGYPTIWLYSYQCPGPLVAIPPTIL